MVFIVKFLPAKHLQHNTISHIHDRMLPWRLNRLPNVNFVILITVVLVLTQIAALQTISSFISLYFYSNL